MSVVRAAVPRTRCKSNQVTLRFTVTTRIQPCYSRALFDVEPVCCCVRKSSRAVVLHQASGHREPSVMLSRSGFYAILYCSLAIVTRGRGKEYEQCLTDYETGPFVTRLPLYPRAIVKPHSGPRVPARAVPSQHAEVTYRPCLGQSPILIAFACNNVDLQGSLNLSGVSSRGLSMSMPSTLACRRWSCKGASATRETQRGCGTSFKSCMKVHLCKYRPFIAVCTAKRGPLEFTDCCA